MITNNLDKMQVDIVASFYDLGYTFMRKDKNIIEFSNGYYYIHFYIKQKEYYSEDNRSIVKVLIDYCINNFDVLLKEIENIEGGK